MPLYFDGALFHMPEEEKDPPAETRDFWRSKFDWHQFEYSEVGTDNDDGFEGEDPAEAQRRKDLKKLEMFLRKPWCCK